MFSNLKSAFQKTISKEIDESDDYGEDIQAIIILLLEACQIDGETEEIEINFIKNLLINKFNFSKAEAEENINNALKNDGERIEIFSQIKIILNQMDHKERIDVIEMMWGVILADGIIDDFEANLMRRMNGLLYVSGIESAEAKERALKTSKQS
ncbi:TerB family tellurite resistance protein [Alphaproteobacteria bacterium]|nr:TerB family tellurite resistance protein [Alphaproteobacteria bacterium]